jgi:hypothetical protein
MSYIATLFSLLLFSATANAVILKGGSGGGSGPQPNSVTAANNTATYAPLCQAIAPFYAVIGNSSGALWSIGIGAYTAPTTKIGIDSATKWVYSTYLTQIRNGYLNFTTADQNALNMIDGYVNLGESSGGSSCPSSLSPRTPAQCILQSPGPNGQPNQAYGAQVTDQGSGTSGIPGTSAVGVYFYQGGHDEVHAATLSPLANLTDTQITSVVNGQLGTTSAGMNFVQPLLSGGAAATVAGYSQMLMNIMSGSLLMNASLQNAGAGNNTVCTLSGGNYAGYTVGGVAVTSTTTNWQFTNGICNAQYSPIAAPWVYGEGFWVELMWANGAAGDGAFSSPGSDGYYPWISANLQQWGIIARSAGAGQGGASAQCGELIRDAYNKGVYQPGPYPQ